MAGLNTTIAVFYAVSEGGRLNLIKVHLEADAAEGLSAEAVARGYRYAGVCCLVEGVPRVEIEPDCAAVMAAAGPLIATVLGPLVKQQQLDSAPGNAESSAKGQTNG